MKNLKRFLVGLSLSCLVLWPSWSDVVLSDQEAQKILIDLENCEKFTREFELQSQVWLEELSSLNLKLNESETLQKNQQIYYERQLKSQDWKVIKISIIVGVISFVVGLVGGVAVSVALK